MSVTLDPVVRDRFVDLMIEQQVTKMTYYSYSRLDMKAFVSDIFNYGHEGYINTSDEDLTRDIYIMWEKGVTLDAVPKLTREIISELIDRGGLIKVRGITHLANPQIVADQISAYLAMDAVNASH